VQRDSSLIDILTDLSQKLNLTSYQICVIEKNYYKYNLNRLVQQGGLLYAPYRCDYVGNLQDVISKLFCGQRADLIGQDRMLVINKRGIKVYNDGCFSACINGEKYQGDAFGNPIEKSNCIRIV